MESVGEISSPNVIGNKISDNNKREDLMEQTSVMLLWKLHSGRFAFLSFFRRALSCGSIRLFIRRRYTFTLIELLVVIAIIDSGRDAFACIEYCRRKSARRQLYLQLKTDRSGIQYVFQ